MSTIAALKCQYPSQRVTRAPRPSRTQLSYEKHDEYRDYRDWYSDYLRSPKWRAKRAKVMKRANYTCEGCLEKPAKQVHHTTYMHAGDELLYELQALCYDCHKRAHTLKMRAYDPCRKRWVGVDPTPGLTGARINAYH